MKAFIFVQNYLEFCLEGEEAAVKQYVDSFRHGAGLFGGGDVKWVYRNEDDEIEDPDTTDPVSADFLAQIESRESELGAINV